MAQLFGKPEILVIKYGIKSTPELILSMELSSKIRALDKLGMHISENPASLQKVIQKAHDHNRWFTKDNCRLAIEELKENFLNKKRLEEWLKGYIIKENPFKKIGLILAGNIPLVGFHDILCSFITGNIAQIKLSDKDKYLTPYFIRILKDIDHRSSRYFKFVERLESPDAVIATGRNSSAFHFERYFAKYPHIIRKHRNAVAILDGNETKQDLRMLGNDIFSYFGLGCRNISKVYLPKHYNIEILMEQMHEYKDMILHNKYRNNYDFNYAIYLLNRENFFMNGCLILREHTDIVSRIACLHFERYDDIEALEKKLLPLKDQIQCISSNTILKSLKTVPLGATQSPGLGDYADGKDTIEFLTGLK